VDSKCGRQLADARVGPEAETAVAECANDPIMRGIESDSAKFQHESGRRGLAMKFIHTADWHLGRSLGPHDLLEHQQSSIQEIIKVAFRERPDAIVIAGDLYDRSVPPEAAMRVFEQAVIDLRAIAPVIAIAGNHDGAGRVTHFGAVLGSAGIHIVGTSFGRVPYVSLRDTHGEVRFHLMPFAMPAEVRHALQGEVDGAVINGLSSHDAATEARIATIELQSGIRHVLVAHLFTQAGSQSHESESERDISVGGSSVVRPSVFEGFHYVALGHLHKAHEVIPGRVRYSGSIGRYSFSEEAQEKSVSIVELDADGVATIRPAGIAQRFGMKTIRGLFANVLGRAPDDADRRTAFVRILLEDSVPQFEAFRRLREHYPFLIEVTYDQRASEFGTAPALDQPERRDPMTLVRAYCADRLGKDCLSHAAMALAEDLMDKARGARAKEENS
jgi:exonuclease SbcD